MDTNIYTEKSENLLWYIYTKNNEQTAKADTQSFNI